MSRELLQGLGSIKTNGTSVILENNYLKFTGYVWPTSTIQYIPINDYTHTFEYDITFESDAGNYFYIGIERYTIDKTTGSNSSCIYQVATNNTAKSKQRVRGTVNLNQVIADSLYPSYIRLRILNNWTNSSASNATAKIYNISLREITETTNKINMTGSGIIYSDTFWETYQIPSINKLNVVETQSIIEY